MFDSASYKLGDEYGNEVLMAVDYAVGEYKIKPLKEKNKFFAKTLKKRAGEIAADLLKRKHRVNFSDRIKV